jgi:hypothetical protein
MTIQDSYPLKSSHFVTLSPNQEANIDIVLDRSDQQGGHIYVPNNLQGAASFAINPINVTPGTLLLEWGHYIEKIPNLLMINGNLQVDNLGAFNSLVTTRMTMNDVLIDERFITLLPNERTSVAVGARLKNATIGHHVFKLFAETENQGVFTRNCSTNSISGQA